MLNDLNCPSCDSASVVYQEISDDSPVVCGVCGTFLATRGEFRHILERQAEGSGLNTTGC
jgi:ribosomal protein S27E